MLLALILGVATLAAAVTSSGSVASADVVLGHGFRAGAEAMSVHTATAISTLAGTDLVLPLTATCALLLLLFREWRGALTVVLAVIGTQLVVHLIKTAVERPRPAANADMASASGFSFPSAHSATAVALYATLAFLAARRFGGLTRKLIVALGATVVLAVGASRVLVGAHHPTDVLAGWLTGAALIVAAWLLVHVGHSGRRGIRRAGAPPLPA